MRLRTKRRARISTAIISACTLTVMLMSSCGISLDKSPRAIQPATSTTTTIDMPSINAAVSNLYFVLDESLIPVPTKVPDRATSTLISELLKPIPKSDEQLPIRSAIPTGTKLLSATTRGTQLTIDLSEEFDNLVGLSRQRALSQIVFTVTDIGASSEATSVREVKFQIAGEDIQVASPVRGDVPSAGVCDFKGLLATKDQLTDATIPDDETRQELIDALDDRRTSLDRICGK